MNCSRCSFPPSSLNFRDPTDNWEQWTEKILCLQQEIPGALLIQLQCRCLILSTFSYDCLKKETIWKHFKIYTSWLPQKQWGTVRQQQTTVFMTQQQWVDSCPESPHLTSTVPTTDSWCALAHVTAESSSWFQKRQPSCITVSGGSKNKISESDTPLTPKLEILRFRVGTWDGIQIGLVAITNLLHFLSLVFKHLQSSLVNFVPEFFRCFRVIIWGQSTNV